MPSDKTSFIYGRMPVLEMLRDGKQVERLYVQRGITPDTIKELKAFAHGLGVPMQVVPKARLDRITRKNHQGVIALTAVVEYEDLESVVQMCYDRGESPLVVVIDGVTDVRNVGAIARSAEVFGITAMAIPAKGAAPLNAHAMKTSAGALRYLPVSRVLSLYETCCSLQENGLLLCVADQKAEQDLTDVDFTVPVAVVMGSEDKGVQRRINEMADVRFRIPQYGQTDSLNVSVAAGVIFYEVRRQRKTM